MSLLNLEDNSTERAEQPLLCSRGTSRGHNKVVIEKAKAAGWSKFVEEKLTLKELARLAKELELECCSA